MVAQVFASNTQLIACWRENRNKLRGNEKATGAWIWSTNKPKKFLHKNTCDNFIIGCCHGDTKKERGTTLGVKKDESSICDCHSVVIIFVAESQVYNNNNMPECF